MRGLLIAAATAAAATALRQQPTPQLTKLGATLSVGQRVQLKAAAARVISGGRNRWPSYTQPGQTANYFTPDDGTDHRRHYGSQYVRDFTYTFTMAPDLVVAADVSNSLDYFLSGEASSGSVPEGGKPPAAPINVVNCFDNSVFIAIAAAKYATMFGDLPWQNRR